MFVKGNVVFLEPANPSFVFDEWNPENTRGVVLEVSPSDASCRVVWDNGNVNFHLCVDLKFRDTGSFKVGDKVRISPTSKFYRGEPNNPIGVTGVVIDNDAGYLPYRVKWPDEKFNTYFAKDLILTGVDALVEESQPVVPSPKKIRILLSSSAILEDDTFGGDYLVTEVDSLRGIPPRLEVLRLYFPSTQEFAMTIDQLIMAGSEEVLTRDYPFIYIRTDEGFYCQVANVQATRAPVFEAKEEGRLYVLTYDCDEECLIQSGDIVRLIEQENPDKYFGKLPYYIHKVNTDLHKWVGCDAVLTEA